MNSVDINRDSVQSADGGSRDLWRVTLVFGFSGRSSIVPNGAYSFRLNTGAMDGFSVPMRYHAPVEHSLRVFSGTIYKIGLIRYVDVPAQVTRSMSANGAHVPVRGTVEGIPLLTTLVSRGKGCYRVAIHGDIRRKLKIDAGDVVEIAIERDDRPREPVLPAFLVLSLRNSPRAQAAFRNMTTALRRQIVRYLTSVKQQTTLERRVAKFVRRLEGGTRHNRPKRKSNATVH